MENVNQTPKQSFIDKIKGFFATPPAYHKAGPRPTAATSTPTGLDRNDFIQRISHVETRNQDDPYKTVGVTGDIGRYQVSPQTLEAWSEPWLGKKYDQESFMQNPQAQDQFFTEYMNVADKYQLNPEEAAIVWHRGWGVLGDQANKPKRGQLMRQYVDGLMQDPNSSGYLNTFRNYGTQ